MINETDRSVILAPISPPRGIAMVLRRCVCFVALALLVLSTAACHKAPPPVAASKPPEVFFAQPSYRDDVQDYEDFPGRTEGYKQVEVRARVSGELTKVYFDDGADVKIGDPLFDIDPRPFALEVLRAQASVKQAEANLVLKRAQHARAQGLRGRTPPSISKEELEVAKADMDAAQAARALALTAEKIAELNRSWCHITAEIDGRVSRRMLDAHNQ